MILDTSTTFARGYPVGDGPARRVIGDVVDLRELGANYSAGLTLVETQHLGGEPVSLVIRASFHIADAVDLVFRLEHGDEPDLSDGEVLLASAPYTGDVPTGTRVLIADLPQQTHAKRFLGITVVGAASGGSIDAFLVRDANHWNAGARPATLE